MARASLRRSRTQRLAPLPSRSPARPCPKTRGESFSRTFLSLSYIGPMPTASPSLRSRITRVGQATGDRAFKTVNRVAGGLSPPAPTAPRMRVRTGRFPRVQSDNPCHHPKAGYVTLPPDYGFTFIRCYVITETEASRSLTKVQAFTVSQPLRWAFGYYALC